MSYSMALLIHTPFSAGFSLAKSFALPRPIPKLSGNSLVYHSHTLDNNEFPSNMDHWGYQGQNLFSACQAKW